MFWKRARPKLYMFQSELQAIVAEASRHGSEETGGSLFGTFTHGDAPVIWLASGPGPAAVFQFAHFEQDVGFITRWQRELNSRYGLQYIGGWHSHHTLGIRRPSSGDIAAARRYARRHGRRRNVEIIVTLEGDGLAPHLWPFVYNAGEWGGPEEGELKLLPGESPLRVQLADEAEFVGEHEGRSVAVLPRAEDAHSLAAVRQISGSTDGDKVEEDSEAGMDSDSAYLNRSRAGGESQDLPAVLQAELSGLIRLGIALDQVDIEKRRRLWLIKVPVAGRDHKALAVALEEAEEGSLWMRGVAIVDLDVGRYTQLEQADCANGKELFGSAIDGRRLAELYRTLQAAPWMKGGNGNLV